MKSITRRSFLKTSFTAGLIAGAPALIHAAEKSDAVRLAIIGLGGLNIPGSVGGRGRQLISALRKTPGNKIVALCDVDQTILDDGVAAFRKRGEAVDVFKDPRQVFESKSVDAVVVALPNHWHALATIWACQAGKDVYVEKPFSHDIWEGRQMVAAARKYRRMVQVGTQNRSSSALKEAFDYVRSGAIGSIRHAHALVYRPREGIGSVSAPVAPPASVDYDLWCGPTQKRPLNRPHLHYEWHWFWDTGNGEMGNDGVHVIDICRWALGSSALPPRVVSIGGRFGTQDSAETPNTQIAFFDYKPAPLICEVRNLKTPTSKDGIGKFRGRESGIVLDCEGGYVVGDSSAVNILGLHGEKLKQFLPNSPTENIEVSHLTAFLNAVRSRKPSDLAAEASIGHHSAGCCHMANVSHRLGRTAPPDAIADTARADTQLSDAFERCREYLSDNGVNLGRAPAVLGPSLTLDSHAEKFVGTFAAEANQLCRREYRQPFVVPDLS
jgi:predicted dehydrogenase